MNTTLLLVYVTAIHILGVIFSSFTFHMWRVYRKYYKIGKSLLVFSIAYFLFSVLSLGFIGVTSILAVLLKG